MVKTVRWNNSATLSLSKLAEYLESEASYDIAVRFVNLVYSKIDKLMKYPEMGRRAPKTKTIRFINIDKSEECIIGNTVQLFTLSGFLIQDKTLIKIHTIRRCKKCCL